MVLRLILTLAAALIAAALLAPGDSIAQQRSLDQVFFTKGAPARGDIPDSGMSRDKVTLEVSGNAREIGVNDIVRITFKEEPAELNAARTSVLQKNYGQALTDLKKLDGQKIDREFIKQDIDFYRALCLARL